MIPRYYEFSNRTKILSGVRALENIPHELKLRGASRPMIISGEAEEERGILKVIFSSMSGSELVIVKVLGTEEVAKEKYGEQAVLEFVQSACDSIIAVGNVNSFQLGKAVCDALFHENEGDILLFGSSRTIRILPVPFIIVPAGNAGLEITEEPDIVVLDPRMSLKISPRDLILSSLDIICHCVESFTCLKKNPISDAFAFSALTLIGENLDTAVKHQWDKNSKHHIANSALLSGIALKNSGTGIIHAIANALEQNNKLPHSEAISIILPHCMEASMIKFDEHYGELLLPLSGPEIFADTPHEQRGRKFVQTIRNMLSECHERFGIPICLSEAGVKRSDFGIITELCLKSEHLLYDAAEMSEETISNILNMSF